MQWTGTQQHNLAIMDCITEWSGKEAKRMRMSKLTFIEWEDNPTMAELDAAAPNKKFKAQVYTPSLHKNLLRQTDELERDIVRLEHLIYSIQNKMYAF